MKSHDDRKETPAPIVDLLESFVLFFVPTFGFGFGIAALGGSENFVSGLVVGGLIGAMLIRAVVTVYR